MPPSDPDLRGGRISDRLAALRTARFIGRHDELSLFRAALSIDPPPFTVLYVHGPGGVGKTALLHAFSGIATDSGRRVAAIDGRDIQPTREAFRAAFEETAGTTVPNRTVVIVDTCERLAPLDAWLRQSFLPQLPADVMVVLAGRRRPSGGWRTDLAWAPLTRIVELRNFAEAETIAFLQSRGVAPALHRQTMTFTHGHPLALTLVADAVAAGRGASAPETEASDVVHQLLAAIVDQLPPGARRDALDISACARVTTEPLLCDLLGPDEGPRAYEWLQGQSFVEHSPRGVFPHDLAREVFLAEARWRDEPRLRALARRVYVAVHARILAAPPPEQLRLQMDALFITRTQPTHGPFFDWDAMDVHIGAASPDDASWMVETVRRHEGDASARLADAWWRAQPAAFHVFRDAADARFGFLTLLELAHGAASVVSGDPAPAAALRFVERHGRASRGDIVVYLRWWMHAARYQEVTAAINLTAAHVVSQCTTRPEIAWNFVSMADPAFWAPHFAGVNFARVPDADFEIGGRRYGVFAHDWRFEPPAAWVSGDRTPMPFAPDPAGAAWIPPLDKAAFLGAVRCALRDCARPDALAVNALVRARLLATGGGDPAARLRRLLHETAESLKQHPRDQKLYRAVWHTYFEPLATQEQVAERLDLPFSTYRRHLRQAIDRIGEALWQREQKASSFRSSS